MSALGDWIPEDIPEAIMEDATRWMALLDSDRCNEADRLSFALWLDEDLQHRWAFQELSEVWARLRTLADVKPLLDQPSVRRLQSSRPSQPRPPASVAAAERSRDRSALAASVLVVLGFLLHMTMGAPTERFSTGTGEVRDVTLADGSVVELNARTSMDVQMDREERRVRLDAGDAIFHVASGARPFVVSTDRGSVAALGTSFAVEQEDGRMEVSVLEGRVSVTATAAGLPLTEYDGKVDFAPRAETTVLDPGQRLNLSANAGRAEAVAPEELRQQLAWRHGYVVYDDEPLRAVVGDMRRYSRVNIQLADERLK
jgi:transmembrane sensor